MNANESCHGDTEAIHSFGGLANTGSALNIRVYLRLTAFSRFITRELFVDHWGIGRLSFLYTHEAIVPEIER